MNAQDVQDVGALAMVAVAMGVVGWLAYNGNETATGALISVISAGTGYYLRGRIAPPDTGATTALPASIPIPLPVNVVEKKGTP